MEQQQHEQSIEQMLESSLAAQQAGDAQQAERGYRAVLARKPENLDAHYLLGCLLHTVNRNDESAEHLRRALAIAPEMPEIHTNYAIVCRALGRIDEAAEHLREAAKLNVTSPDAHKRLAVLLEEAGRYEEAIDAYARAEAVSPGDRSARDGAARARANLAMDLDRRSTDLLKRHEADEAVTLARRAVELEPKQPGYWNNLGAALAARLDLDDGLACYRKALEIRPDFATARSNLLVALHYKPGISPAELFEEHRRFQTDTAAGIERVSITPKPLTHRRIRVGYVSRFFRQHAVGVFVAPLLRAHDRSRFEITCYSDVCGGEADRWTDAMKRCVDHWHDVTTLSDQRLAERIAADGQDLLVDLSGHLTGNRLLAFARRPAPVQATYIGYQDTTGLDAMDYRITDAHADPPGMTDAFCTEKLVRLPCFFAYLPSENADAIAPPPSAASGVVTFGSLNNTLKCSSSAIDVWSQILQRVPRSRMMLLVDGHGHIERTIRDAFARRRIAPDRLVLISRRSHGAYLRSYHQIDIALDPTPFSGHTTTCDALWMGAPVITLAGDRYAARMSTSVLMNVGLAELVAGSAEQYVEIAAVLAADSARLTSLRSSMRDRVARSPIVDAVGFTRNLEAAYLKMVDR